MPGLQRQGSRGRRTLPEAKAVGAAKTSLEGAERQKNAADDARRRGAEIVVETLRAVTAPAYLAKGRRGARSSTKRWSGRSARLSRRREPKHERGRGSPGRGGAPRTELPTGCARTSATSAERAHIFDDLGYALRVDCGLADPPPRTLAEHVRAADGSRPL